ncbi:MAG: hypothetical protein P1U83_03595 [Roseovarius sp.]|nr:hypothetical protein [Roseovarius sp.]
MYDKALLTASVTIALWILTRWIELGSRWFSNRRERHNLIRSLYAEVDFNTKDLHFFIENSADISAIEARLAQDSSYLPHVTDAHHTIIYSSHIDKLHHLENALTARLVLYYGLLEKIKEQIDGINLASFKSVSTAGKMAVLNRITVNSVECQKIGVEVLGMFSDTYPNLRLIRHNRTLISTKQR